MLEQWVIDNWIPLKGEKLILLADPAADDPGRCAGRRWLGQGKWLHGAVLSAATSALREMYENLRDDASAKIILVDRTREKAKLPLFYPDLEARCKAGPG